MDTAQERRAVAEGRACLGVEFGSTRIKACLIGADHRVIGTGSRTWENEFSHDSWTYDLGDTWAGLQGAIGDLLMDVEDRCGARPTTFRALGVSAMMHGYLAFDDEGCLLVPFRTWRNTSTARAAAELSDLLGQNIPHRWSVAHLYQAVLDDEPHVRRVDYLTTLSGYVHWRLTGRKVLGVGDAAGMFPIDPVTGSYDGRMLASADELLAGHGFGRSLAELLPAVLLAGREAGRLTPDGAALLDPTGALGPGIPLCPPEGDAGTGMVATHSISPRTGNVSVGTSVFAMVVLDKPLELMHREIDVVATPMGAPVAMVHCNNGASELEAWASVFQRFAAALGRDVDADAVFEVLLREALSGEPDGGGILAYNFLSGEPIAGGPAGGRPIVVRTPDSRLTLANFARALVFGVFGTLTIGMRVLKEAGIDLETLFAHGGLFRTERIAGRLLAAAVDAPVSIGGSAPEGGAWGIAVLAAFLASSESDLERFLAREVFIDEELEVIDPDLADVRGYGAFLERYTAGLALQQVAVDVL
ncbi:xylulokinase [Leekyejoonella antrihumi]|uniref:ATPase n=1 Tax=Leekyejoonella antrihumi TaxID=1660198 RepID=A0A563E6S8_9MICO|nr:FGGY-family carbohydrate kinase [Leekyejoonella antrihumi]TWP38207.1 ATPase [Leekyejoonella antrihumi]